MKRCGKIKLFFTPMKSRDSCEEQERKYLLPKKCDGAAVKQSRWSAHCVWASSALTRIKALQKMFPKHPRIPCL